MVDYLITPASGTAAISDSSGVSTSPGANKLWASGTNLFWGTTQVDGGGGGGTIGGSITDNQVAIGATTADSIEGSANLTYDGTNLVLARTADATSRGISIMDNEGTETIRLATASGDQGLLYLKGPTGGNAIYLDGNGDSYFDSGDVGIGTTSPSYKLHVVGDILATSNINVGAGAGYALESYSNNQRYGLKYGAAGTVDGSDILMLTNREGDGDIQIATSSGDTGGAGEETTRMTVKHTTGYVGIGTTSPASMLHVSGGNANQLRLTAGNTAWDARMYLDTMNANGEWEVGVDNTTFNIANTDQGGTPPFNITYDKKIGIGTGSPSYPLHVVSTGYEMVSIESSSVYGSVFYLDATEATDGKKWFLQSCGTSSSNGPGNLAIGNEGTVNMAIESGGNVGIGTIDPAQVLDVVGTDVAGVAAKGATIRVGSDVAAASNKGGSIVFGDTGTDRAIIKGSYLGGSSEGQLTFSTAADSGGALTARMTINEDGVGIGTTAPVGKLEVIGSNGTVAGTPDSDAEELVIRNAQRAGISIIHGEGDGEHSNITLGSASDMNGANISWDYYNKVFSIQGQNTDAYLRLASANNVEAMRIDKSQKVGIGTTSPAYKLDVRKSGHSVALISGSGNGSSPVCHIIDSSDQQALLVEGTDAVGNDKGVGVYIYHNDASPSESNKTFLNFQMNNDQADKKTYGQILGGITDYTEDTEDGFLKFSTITAGSMTEGMRLSNSAGLGVSGNITISGGLRAAVNDSFTLGAAGGQWTEAHISQSIYLNVDASTTSRAGGNKLWASGSTLYWDTSQVLLGAGTVATIAANWDDGASAIAPLAMADYGAVANAISTAGTKEFLYWNNDLATLHAKNLSIGNAASFPADTTGVTASASDNSTKFATTAYVDAAGGVSTSGSPVANDFARFTDADTIEGREYSQVLSDLSLESELTDLTSAEISILDGATVTTDELNILDGVTSTAAELNILDGVTATTAELNYTDGVTSNIQTQIDAASGANPTLSNLDPTAINLSLVSDTDNTDDLGSSAVGWRKTYCKEYNGFNTNTSSYEAGATIALSMDYMDGLAPMVLDLSAAGGILTNAVTRAGVSDRKVKDNIKDYTKGLSLINQLEPKSWKWIDGRYGDTSETNYGLMADDLEVIDSSYTEVHSTHETFGEINNITKGFGRQYNLALLNAVKELSAKNDALEARIVALEGNL